MREHPRRDRWVMGGNGRWISGLADTLPVDLKGTVTRLCKMDFILIGFATARWEGASVGWDGARSDGAGWEGTDKPPTVAGETVPKKEFAKQPKHAAPEWWVPVFDDGTEEYPVFIPPPWVQGEAGFIEFEQACHDLSLEDWDANPGSHYFELGRRLRDEAKAIEGAPASVLYNKAGRTLGQATRRTMNLIRIDGNPHQPDGAAAIEDLRDAAVTGFHAGVLAEQARQLRDRADIGRKGRKFPGGKKKPATESLLKAAMTLENNGKKATPVAVAKQAGAVPLEGEAGVKVWLLNGEHLTRIQIRGRLNGK